MTQIENTIEKTMGKLLPQMALKIKESWMKAIQAIVTEAANRIEAEICQVVGGHLRYELRRSDLKVKSELLESYNRKQKWLNYRKKLKKLPTIGSNHTSKGRSSLFRSMKRCLNPRFWALSYRRARYWVLAVSNLYEQSEKQEYGFSMLFCK